MNCDLQIDKKSEIQVNPSFVFNYKIRNNLEKNK